MQLIVAEKPSVGQHIAKVLGANEKKDNHFEGNGYLVSWCVGHLVGLAPADTYHPDFKKWEVSDLPIIPTEFQYVPSEGKQRYLHSLCDLMNRPDVDVVINACDSGREGELIFALVYQYAACNKYVKRLWISSMEDVAILEGFQNLREGTDMNNLLSAAMCRAKADWLMGINGTRLFSCLYGQSLNVGRVISPTLSMIVQRNAEIQAFQPTPFYFSLIECDGFSFSSERLATKQEANAMVEHWKSNPIIVEKVEKTEHFEKTPLLYDLTTLQREANRKLGFSAQQTLDYAQSLYERKYLTYPRTDSNYLTEDMQETVREVVNLSTKILGFDCEPPQNFSSVINSMGVSDHHAIIPTMSIEHCEIAKLPYGEREILELVMVRSLQAVDDLYRFEKTTVTVLCGEERLSTHGETVIDKGFKVFDKFAPHKRKETAILPKTLEGNVLTFDNATLKEGRTTPPKQYTEDTILYAMERSEEKEELDKNLSGIGTPATRAATLEKLVSTKLVERKGSEKTKHLLPTEKGQALSSVLPDSVQSLTLTSEWEEKLLMVEQGIMNPDIFMEEIEGFVRNLVTTYEKSLHSEVVFPKQFDTVGTCPRCGREVTHTPKAFSCEDKSCGFILWKDNKFFTAKRKEITEKIAKDLLSTGQTDLKGCYSEKTGKTYDCTVILVDTGEKYVSFKMEFNNDKQKDGGN
ncbi:MAG: DNA topoisomerase [Eubacteriales bacterium]